MIKFKPSTYRTAIFAEEKMTQPNAYTRRARLAMFWFAASLLILTLGALPASADEFTFTSCHISSSACLGGSVPSGFGTVTLTQSGTSVIFDVVLNNGNTFVETGAGAAEIFLFNDTVSGSTITNPTINAGAPGGLSGLTNISPAEHADGTGDFTASVECTNSSECNGNSGLLGNELTFTVTNATLAQLETANANGNIFVADIICGSTQTGCAGGLTGDIDVSNPVPEPVSMLLFGSGLVAIGAKLRRRKSQNLVAA